MKMKNFKGIKYVSLLLVIVLVTMAVLGCQTKKKPSDTIVTARPTDSETEDNVEISGEDTTEEINYTTGETSSGDQTNTSDGDQSDTTVKVTDEKVTTTLKDDETATTTNKSDEPTTTVKKPEPTTTAKKPEPTTTTKKQEPTTTTKKQEPTTTTKKPDATTTTKKPETTTTKKPEPTTTAKPSLSKAEQMASDIVDSIIRNGMSDFEKAITIHDWLTYNIDYDQTYTHYYVEETLRDRTGVCQGYALCFEMMCDFAGLETIFVTGTGNGESHAWNQVKINGTWYNVDVTWDDPTYSGKDKNDHTNNNYDYFLISDAQIEKNHKTSSIRQKCSSNYDRRTILKYAANSGVNPNVAYAENSADFSAAVKKFAEAGKTEMILWYYDVNVTSSTMWDTIYDLIEKAPYPVEIKPSYPPINGVTVYVLGVTPLKEWNKIAVVKSAEELVALIDSNFDAGKTTFTVRYEPTDGNVKFFASSKYGYSTQTTYYNDNKSALVEITKY